MLTERNYRKRVLKKIQHFLCPHTVLWIFLRWLLEVLHVPIPQLSDCSSHFCYLNYFIQGGLVPKVLKFTAREESTRNFEHCIRGCLANKVDRSNLYTMSDIKKKRWDKVRKWSLFRIFIPICCMSPSWLDYCYFYTKIVIKYKVLNHFRKNLKKKTNRCRCLRGY